MAIFKCKMCGGTLEISENQTTAVCEYCGTTQTLPKLDDERRANLYDRANHFRRSNEFDKAAGIYEQILNDDTTDAEAYWSLVLCRYGIEYVEDPTTHKRVPTVNRAQYTSIFDDDNYKAALEHADSYQRTIYEQEAAAINEIQKGILEISQKEEPFDVFICYKETDANGRRTQDSVLANDLYHQLTAEGFKVFFSRITLEDKLGTAYEPYIFAALNSAKVMVVIGTKQEHFNAVWVKNEWSRFLALIKNGAKKTLIPAYRDMDPYDLPEEFSHLQAQDMSKLGFMQDLIRGIKKIADDDAPKTAVKETVVVSGGTDIAPLLKRAFMYLEDGDWENADSYCERVLDADPENAQAYLGKLMAELRCRKQDELKDCQRPFDHSNNYQKALRFGDDALKAELEGDITYINERNENERKTGVYEKAMLQMESASHEASFKAAAGTFATIPGFKDADEKAKECLEKAEIARKDAVYDRAISEKRGNYVAAQETAIELPESICGWKDADAKILECQRRIEEIKEENERLEREAAERAETEKKKAKKRNKVLAISFTAVAFVAAFVVLLITVIIPTIKYNNAVNLRESGDFDGAIAAFEALGDYKDAEEKALATHYEYGEALLAAENYDAAATEFAKANDYQGANSRIRDVHIAKGNALVAQKDYDGAIEEFKKANDSESVLAAYYTKGNELAQSEKYFEAVSAYDKAGSYMDAEAMSRNIRKKLAPRMTIGAVDKCTIGVKSETVIVVGERNDELRWSDVVSIAAGNDHIVGLKSYGSVYKYGNNYFGQCNTDTVEWTDLVAVAVGDAHTVGLKANGTVIATGDNKKGQCNVREWTDIVAIAAASSYTIGLKADKTVVAVGNNRDGQCDVSDWIDIVAVAAGTNHTVGLKSDGTVVSVGYNFSGQCDVSGWTNIVAVAAGTNHTVGLKADGTVVAVGNNSDGRCDVSEWTDIVAIAAGHNHTVGLKSDGTVVAVGDNSDGQCDVSDWTDIIVP